MIQFKIRTEYTFGETYAPIERVIERLKELGCAHAGIVDKASTWGHVEWHEACVKAGITPMLGVELIVADEDDTETAMWFIARTKKGLSELYHAASLAHQQTVKTMRGSKPRLYQSDVLRMSDKILKFAGDVLDEEFLKKAGAIIDFSPASRILNISKQRIADAIGADTVAVSDNAYAFPKDRETLELLADRGLKATAQHILSADELYEHCGLDGDFSDLAPRKFEMPKAPMIRVDGDLEELCREGIEFRKRENDLVWDDEHEERLRRELDMIKSKDFESYFLIVADMVQFAKKHMLVGPSRGSAAGSLVCYLTRITEIDPIPPGLFFERFIDVSRTDLPDIDLDFPDNKRHMVFDYMAEKYGKENVAHIGTISKFKPKSALWQVCKKLRIPSQAIGGVKVVMIERSSADSRATDCLLDTLETTDPGKKLCQMYPEVKRAADLEGHASHTGVHAAGLLVCNKPLEDFCTVTASGIAQMEKNAAEKLGLLKIDVLGLRTLGILENSGQDLDWYRMKFDDQEVYDVFNRQALSGIFQFEGEAMRSIAKFVEFNTIDDIDAVTALARPGPFAGGVTQQWLERRAGGKYQPIHPKVEKYMAHTYGLPIYQEQTLAIVREIGQFNWKDTSTIRKAMSKRMGREFFDKFWSQFKKGAKAQGIDEDKAWDTWHLINHMGSWQMNKAHTYSYAVISYWTAALKAKHPLHFAAATLRNAKDYESAVGLLREMDREGIRYERFDPWKSDVSWSVQNGVLMAGYDSLHGFGEVKARKYIEAREAGKLTDEMVEKALAARSAFDDIFPIQTNYGHIYRDPKSHNIIGKVHYIEELDGSQEGSYVFLGELVQKNLRDSNEEVLIKKRHGKVLKGPTTFLDLRIKDDTDQILVRINRFDYKKMGLEIFENVPKGAVLMIRAHMAKGIRFGFVNKWKRLDA